MSKPYWSILVGLAWVITVATPARATLIINKPNFANVADLTLNGAAAQVGNVLRLTPSLQTQAGSAFSTNQVSLNSNASFSTFFEFQISQPLNGGADGLVFVVQTVGNNVGGAGGGIGYAGINNSLGVEFDTFNNGGVDNGNGNHVGIDLNGSIASVALAPVATPMDTGIPFFAWVDYDGNTDNLEVRLSTANVRPLSPLLTHNVDLVNVLGQTNAFVGFTSGTGLAGNNHDILQWQLDNTFNPINGVPAPSSLALLAIGALGSAGFVRRRQRHD